MRRAGGLPRYPLTRRAAEERLRAVAGRQERLEAEAALRGWTPEAEAEHASWRAEAEALRDAFAFFDVDMRALPRCGCNKRAHPSPESAARHARALRLVDDRQKGGRVDVYACEFHRPRPGEGPAWHVGHGRLPGGDRLVGRSLFIDNVTSG